MALRKISPEELRDTLKLHTLWAEGNEDGVRANFQDVDLQGAYLQGADLQNTDLSGANLQGVDLRGAILQGTDLQGADLQYANLQYANLQGADLRGADLRRTGLQGADLRGAICDSNVQKSWSLEGSKWLRADVPWWLGHCDQSYILLYNS